MGFYIRKSFSFGPLRLNLSRSGLGASFGVKGARIGVGPRGSYIHAGRGGLYYRQTLHSHSGPSRPSLEVPAQVFSTSSLQEIASSPAIGMVDSSAARLLQELNRIKRQRDMLPILVIVGAVLFIRLFMLDVPWWVWFVDALATTVLAIWVRNYDVTTGTAILDYSFEGDTGTNFSKLRSAFQQMMQCKGIWHVDAAGATSDWKRNAGVKLLEQRSPIHLVFSLPPKVQSNIDVPILKTRRKALYFFPDRLLVYDSDGVGAVSYGELQAQTVFVQFTEAESVPGDAQQIGSTWQYVNRSGGPDRRFNNNRQLPIMLYGQLSLKTISGLNELFQCSVPNAASQFASAVAECGTNLPGSILTNGGPGNTSSAVGSDYAGHITRRALWLTVFLMTSLILLLPWPSMNFLTTDPAQEQEEMRLVKENQTRQLFAQSLGQRLASRQTNVTITSVNDTLWFHFSKEGPKASRRDGIEPFNKQILFKRFLQPNTESEICALGFRHVRIARNEAASNASELDCSGSPLKINSNKK